MPTQKFHLAIKKAKWNGLNARITKSNTGLSSDERLLQLTVTVPDSLFQQPQLQAKIEVPDTAVNAPVITAEVLNNIQALVSQNLGVNLTISIVEPQKPE